MGLRRPVNQSDHVRAFDLMRFKPRLRLHERIIPLTFTPTHYVAVGDAVVMNADGDFMCTKFETIGEKRSGEIIRKTPIQEASLVTSVRT